MRVLVTGAHGFLGRAVLRQLAAAGAELHALVRQPSPAVAGEQVHVTDLLDGPARRELLCRVRSSHLVHLAWTTAHGHYWEDPSNTTWLAASLSLLSEFSQAGGRHAFMAGSCAEYDWSRGGRIEENVTPRQPRTLYGRCKAELQERAAEAAAARGLRLAWGRVYFPYGEHECPARLIPSLALKLLAGEPAATGPATVARDFLHVDDVARAIALLVEREHDGALDICSGTATSIGTIAQAIGEIVGLPELVRMGQLPARPGDPGCLYGTPRTLFELGWRPSRSLSDGLSDTVAWWRAQTVARAAHMPRTSRGARAHP